MVQSVSKFLHVNDEEVERVYVRMPEYIRRREQALHESSVKCCKADIVNCSDLKTLPQPRVVTVLTQKTSSTNKRSTESKLLSSSTTHTSPPLEEKRAEEKCVIDPPCQPVCCEPEPPVCCPPPQPACCPEPKIQNVNEFLPLYAAENFENVKRWDHNPCDCNCMTSSASVREPLANVRESAVYPPTQIVNGREYQQYAEPLTNVYEEPVNYCYTNHSSIYNYPHGIQEQCNHPQNDVVRLHNAYSSPRCRQKKTTSCC